MKFLRINLFIIIFFFTLILIKTSTTTNLINLVKYDYDERWNKVYGYCENEALGFVRDISKKYNFSINPTIINFKKYPDSSWSLYKPKQTPSKNKFILLNYFPKKKYDLKKLDNKTYISNETIYSVSNIHEILIDKKSGQLDGSIQIFKSDVHKNILIDKVLFKGSENQIKLINFSKINLNNPLDPIDRERKYIIQIVTNNPANLKKIKNISITFNSLIDLEKYNIIEKHQNCYFIEK
ncbi:hypothetical protein N9S67_02050 [Candidatus Pelagibacter sp.]|nr:hypothetical protein [Candidatus Pelagibacter sp.]